MGPKDFYSRHGVNVPDRMTTRYGHLSWPVLPFLWGLPWDELALAWVLTLKPGQIRVTRGETTTDGALFTRVTVFVDRADVIERIEVEDRIPLLGGPECGNDVHRATMAAMKRAGLDPYGPYLWPSWRPAEPEKEKTDA